MANAGCVTPSNSIQHAIVNGALKSDVIVSDDAGNGLETRSDGVYAYSTSPDAGNNASFVTGKGIWVPNPIVAAVWVNGSPPTGSYKVATAGERTITGTQASATLGPFPFLCRALMWGITEGFSDHNGAAAPDTLANGDLVSSVAIISNGAGSVTELASTTHEGGFTVPPVAVIGLDIAAGATCTFSVQQAVDANGGAGQRYYNFGALNLVGIVTRYPGS